MRDLFSCKFKRDKIFFNTTDAVQSVSSCTACVIKTRTNDMSDIYYFYLKIAVLLIVLVFFWWSSAECKQIYHSMGTSGAV